PWRVGALLGCRGDPAGGLRGVPARGRAGPGGTWPGYRPAALSRPLADAFRLGVALLPVRPDHHDHVPPVLLGLRLDEAELLDVAGQPLQQPEPQLRPGLLAAPEHDRHLDLVPRLEEPLDVALLGAVVVRVDLGA